MSMFANQSVTEQALISEYAFFDVDDTLIADKSMLSFQDFWFAKYGDAHAHAFYKKDVLERMGEHACWNDLNRRYYAHFAGREVMLVAKCALEWFEFIQFKIKHFFHRNSVAELKWHQSKNREIVFVSGSFQVLLEPIAQCLGVRYILATKLEEQNDVYTGKILPPQTIGEGKAKAVKDFLAERRVNKSLCYAYGDDISDLPMLQAVGHPCVVRGGRGLERHAKENGWKIISPA